jgi:hypothetical protein
VTKPRAREAFSLRARSVRSAGVDVVRHGWCAFFTKFTFVPQARYLLPGSQKRHACTLEHLVSNCPADFLFDFFVCPLRAVKNTSFRTFPGEIRRTQTMAFFFKMSLISNSMTSDTDIYASVPI